MTELLGQKKCNKCGKTKKLDGFHRDRSHGDGRRTFCKVCTKVINANYWKENAGRFKKRNRDYKYKYKDRIYKIHNVYKENNREFMIWLSAKKRAEKTGCVFDLEIGDVEIPKYCPLLGIELGFNGTVNNRDTSPSIDRKNPDIGYTKENIAIISFRANRIKNNATPEELIMIADRIKDYVNNNSPSFEKEKAC